MTRYFQYEYMFSEEFFALENTRYLFDEKFSDGKIIVMPEKEKPQTDEIQKQLDKLADKRILVLVSDQRFDKEELLLRYQAVMTLKGDKRFIEENEVLACRNLNYVLRISGLKLISIWKSIICRRAER